MRLDFMRLPAVSGRFGPCVSARVRLLQQAPETRSRSFVVALVLRRTYVLLESCSKNEWEREG